MKSIGRSSPAYLIRNPHSYCFSLFVSKVFNHILLERHCGIRSKQVISTMQNIRQDSLLVNFNYAFDTLVCKNMKIPETVQAVNIECTFYCFPFCCFWCFTEAKLVRVTYSDVRKIVDYVRPQTGKRTGGKTALVGSKDLEYGMSRTLKALREFQNPIYELEVFRSKEEGNRWLDQEEE